MRPWKPSSITAPSRPTAFSFPTAAECSSSRCPPDGAWLAKYDMEVYDKTPYVGGERGNDISAWFNRHPGNWQYAILDDDDDMGDHIDHLVRTDFDLGLTEREANRCIELLQRED